MEAVGKLDTPPAAIEDVPILPDLKKFVYFISTKYCRYRIIKEKVSVHIKFCRDNKSRALLFLFLIFFIPPPHLPPHPPLPPPSPSLPPPFSPPPLLVKLQNMMKKINKK